MRGDLFLKSTIGRSSKHSPDKILSAFIGTLSPFRESGVPVEISEPSRGASKRSIRDILGLGSPRSDSPEPNKYDTTRTELLYNTANLLFLL